MEQLKFSNSFSKLDSLESCLEEDLSIPEIHAIENEIFLLENEETGALAKELFIRFEQKKEAVIQQEMMHFKADVDPLSQIKRLYDLLFFLSFEEVEECCSDIETKRDPNPLMQQKIEKEISSLRFQNRYRIVQELGGGNPGFAGTLLALSEQVEITQSLALLDKTLNREQKQAIYQFARRSEL